MWRSTVALVLCGMLAGACGFDTGAGDADADTADTGAPVDASQTPASDGQGIGGGAAVEVAQAAIAAFDGDPVGAGLAMLVALDRGYTWEQLAEGALAGHLGADGRLTLDDGAMVLPEASPADVIDKSGVPVAAGSVRLVGTATLAQRTTYTVGEVTDAIAALEALLDELEAQQAGPGPCGATTPAVVGSLAAAGHGAERIVPALVTGQLARNLREGIGDGCDFLGFDEIAPAGDPLVQLTGRQLCQQIIDALAADGEDAYPVPFWTTGYTPTDEPVTSACGVEMEHHGLALVYLYASAETPVVLHWSRPEPEGARAFYSGLAADRDDHFYVADLGAGEDSFAYGSIGSSGENWTGRAIRGRFFIEANRAGASGREEVRAAVARVDGILVQLFSDALG